MKLAPGKSFSKSWHAEARSAKLGIREGVGKADKESRPERALINRAGNLYD